MPKIPQLVNGRVVRIPVSSIRDPTLSEVTLTVVWKARLRAVQCERIAMSFSAFMENK